ncbi:sugar lactone lactonase YvrE [Bradyrhizobium sp. USDA 4448]
MGFALGPIENSSRYPVAGVEVLDRRFTYKIGNAPIERLATGFGWVEGPVYFGDSGCLLFSDIPNNRIYRWLESDGHLGIYRSPSNYANGHTRDGAGRLVSCEHLRRVTRTELDGNITVLADRYEGKRLSSPNDVIVTSDGAVWFTDPGYGIDSDYEGIKQEAELLRAVYRLDPSGSLRWSLTTSSGRTAWRCRLTSLGSTWSTAASPTAAPPIFASSM